MRAPLPWATTRVAPAILALVARRAEWPGLFYFPGKALRRVRRVSLYRKSRDFWIRALCRKGKKFSRCSLFVSLILSQPKPRQGRNTVAQGASPGESGPHPAFGTPLPLGRERGRGRGWAVPTHGSHRGLRYTARFAGSTLELASDSRHYRGRRPWLEPC